MTHAELAAALYKKGDLESARRYASRVVTDSKNDDEYLRRIAANLPPDTLSINAHASANGFTPFIIPLPSNDPDAANRILVEVIALTEKNPIESTQGQFGPWNQKFRLARRSSTLLRREFIAKHLSATNQLGKPVIYNVNECG